MEVKIERVVVEDTASAADVDATARVFREIGFAGPVEPVYGRRSAELLPWLVEATLAIPFVAFFQSFGSEAGKDAYAALKKWIQGVWAARRDAAGREGTVHLQDPDSSHLILGSTLPEMALDALRELDWSQVAGDYLVWDGGRQRWWDPTKR